MITVSLDNIYHYILPENFFPVMRTFKITQPLSNTALQYSYNHHVVCYIPMTEIYNWKFIPFGVFVDYTDKRDQGICLFLLNFILA